MTSNAPNKRKPAIIVVVIVLAAFFIALVAVISLFGTPEKTGEKVVVEIPPGAGLMKIADLLEQNDVVKCSRGFAFYAWLKGHTADLKAGEYEIEIGRSMGEILEMIVKGRVLLRQITIPEGFTIYQAAKTLSEKGFGDD